MRNRVLCASPVRRALGLLAAFLLPSAAVWADAVYQTLPFGQDWTNTSLITTNNDWSGVPGIIGYRGDDLTGGTAVDPQTVLDDGSGTPVNVIANLANPSGNNTGGVAEAAIADPVVAFQGSGTARAPHLVLHLDTTGQTGIVVSYLLRDIDGANQDAVQPVALHYRTGASGDYINIPEAFVADASSGPNEATLTTPVCVTLPPAAENQAQLQLRFMTTDAAGSDEWIGVDDIVVSTTATCPRRLSVEGTAVAEGNSGTTTATFTVTLSDVALAGGVTFDITTVDDDPVSATAGVDYTTNQVIDAFIPEGETEYEFEVTIAGDTDVEPNETFLVVVSNVVGTLVVVDQDTGVGTIINDDVAESSTIEEIQGAGETTPLEGELVRTEGNIITALTSDGFFLQMPDGSTDGDPNTSSAVFVFNGGAAGIAVGDEVDVVGTAQEFFGLTEIVALSVSITAMGLPLPAPVVFDATTPSPNQPVSATEFERFEGMLISITDGSAGSGNQSFGSDPIAELWITAADRAFRETGIEYPGLPGLPVWDGNPEVFELDQDRLAGMPAATPVLGGSRFDAVGVLGFEFGGWELWATSFTVTAGGTAAPVPEPTSDELTIASLNVFRLFDDIDDPSPSGNESVSTAEYQRRLEKFSRYIREQLRSPDIIGLQEVEKLSVLQALAARITSDDPSVVYTAHLEEGNDIGGIDVGFLVRNTVSVESTTQLSPNVIFSFPGEPDALLNDRPPFLLEATFVDSTGTLNQLHVIVAHQRSLNGIDDVGSNGERVRQKRLEQSQNLAQHIQDLQTAEGAPPLVVIGDFNAFEITDGYVDVIGQIRGEVVPADNLLSGPELVDPPLTNQILSLPAEERYSYIFGGTAQVLDHALTTVATDRLVRHFAYGRGNTDAAPVLINDAGTALRSSDHDGFVLAIVGVGIFVDGFESGDTSEWSATVP